MAIKVTMLLTEQDVENANQIYAATQARSRAHVISIALSLTRFLMDQALKGADFYLREKDGPYERVVMAELKTLNNTQQIAEKLAKLKKS
jgi:hypothetical protein